MKPYCREPGNDCWTCIWTTEEGDEVYDCGGANLETGEVFPQYRFLPEEPEDSPTLDAKIEELFAYSGPRKRSQKRRGVNTPPTRKKRTVGSPQANGGKPP